jgi:hypothetical protein
MIYKTIRIALKTEQYERTSLISGSALRRFGGVSSSCSISVARLIIVKRPEHHLIWESKWTSIYVNKYTYTKIKRETPTKQMSLKTNLSPFHTDIAVDITALN